MKNTTLAAASALALSAATSAIAFQYGEHRGARAQQAELASAHTRTASLESTLPVDRVAGDNGATERWRTVPASHRLRDDDPIAPTVPARLHADEPALVSGAADLAPAWDESLDEVSFALDGLHDELSERASYDLCMLAENADHYAAILSDDPERLHDLLYAFLDMGSGHNKALLGEALARMSHDNEHFMHEQVLERLHEDPSDTEQLSLYQALSSVSRKPEDLESFRQLLADMQTPEAIARGIEIIGELAAQQQGNAECGVTISPMSR